MAVLRGIYPEFILIVTDEFFNIILCEPRHVSFNIKTFGN